MKIPKFDPFTLSEKWTVSRGRDTCGYNICTIEGYGVKTRAMGGGYDMTGTALAEALCLHPITGPIILAMLRRKAKAGEMERWRPEDPDWAGHYSGGQTDGLYGSWYTKPNKRKKQEEKFHIDGGVGRDTVCRMLLKECGIKVERQGYNDRRGRWQTVGWLVRPATKKEVENGW